ncbi:hypothetical protein NE865_13520 [Phthorimaea operculella]|nr:hypothetical protein NE865_13520 [Phthorimaea operculella]
MQHSPKKVTTPSAVSPVPQVVHNMKANNNVSTRSPLQRELNFDPELFKRQFDDMFKEWSEKMEKKQNDDQDFLRKLIQQVKTQNDGIKQSLDFLSAKYDSLLNRVDKMDEERKTDRTYINSLEQKLDILERTTRAASFELRNVPEIKEEKKEDLCDLAIQLGEALSVPIKHEDIRDVHRGFSATGSKKPIIFELQSVPLKEKLLRSAKTLNKQRSGKKLSTEHLRMKCPATPIFISEHLTTKMKRLHFLARDFASTNDFKYCWATTNAIFLRKREGDAPTRLKSEQDLINLREQI